MPRCASSGWKGRRKVATEVHVRKLANSWQYDFKPPGRDREREGGHRTRAAALYAGQTRLSEIEKGGKRITLTEAFSTYMAAKKMKDRSADSHNKHWSRIEPELGHLLLSEVTTERLDLFKQALPKEWSPQTVNHHLGLIRAVLRFMWKRAKLTYPPFIPMESVSKKHHDWYTEEERDRFLAGMFRLHPQWYLFFYVTCRLGLRRGEVYAITRRQIREKPPQLIVDQQVQTAKGERSPKLISRKNDEVLTLAITQDVLDAIQWHIDRGYAGEEFLFFKDGKFSRWLDGHMRSMRDVQRKLKLRRVGHHTIGRHSVASQAATGGESMKAIQAQLGHRSEASTHCYAHLGSKAQLHVVESLRPKAPPHAQSQIETGRAAG
jgi:integrase